MRGVPRIVERYIQRYITLVIEGLPGRMAPRGRKRAALAVLAGALLSCAAHADTVTVFAAASLREALDAQARSFEAQTGNTVVVSYAGSNALARQIEAGAPASLFISADLDWMDDVARHALVVPGSRVNLVGNALVLIAPAKDSSALRIAPGFALAQALGEGRLAMANPNSVPAGRYAKAALEFLGVWGSVEPRAVRAENVRAALLLVARGEAPLGIVYRTDALAERRVRIVDTFPPDSHPAIVYAAALISGRETAAARAFLDFLGASTARVTWQRYGFAPP